jgi:hypothetical protein
MPKSKIIRFTGAAALYAAYFLLAGCAVDDRREPESSKEQHPSAQESGRQSAPNVELIEQFEDMAPDGWLLLDRHPHAATYKVLIPAQGAIRPVDAVGAIVLDGKNEDMVKLGNAVPHWNSDTIKGRQRAADRYSNYAGFEKDVAINSVGYDVKRGRNIYLVAYYNREKGLSCYGRNSGQFECYWGNRTKRMSLYFTADDLAAALPYVLTTPGMD